MSGSVQTAFPALSDVREWSGGPSRSSGGPPGCPGVGVAFPDVREWSGCPLGCPGVVGWPSWMSDSGQKAIPDVRE